MSKRGHLASAEARRADLERGMARALWQLAGGDGRIPRAAYDAAGDLIRLYEHENGSIVALADRVGDVKGPSGARSVMRLEFFGEELAEAAADPDDRNGYGKALRKKRVAIPAFSVELTGDSLRWHGDTTKRNPDALDVPDVTNPPAILTAKGERMYEDIKASYEAKGEPRAAEIAMRTVYARAKTTPGLLRVGMGRPPGVPNRGR